MRRVSWTLPVAVLLLFAVAQANDACPEVVTAAVTKAYPQAKVGSCKLENDHGKVQYEVKLEHNGRKVELDVSPEGTILQTEEIVPLTSVPSKVMAAFEAKYPKAKATRAEKQSQSSGKVSYELKFLDAGGAKHEVTFSEDGTFVEEE
jgi:hypothetical protein